jgi:hypothetical protein
MGEGKELIELVKTIGFIDNKVISKELSIRPTIIEKLNYLKEIKENYTDKFHEITNNLSEKQKSFYVLNKDRIHALVFSEKNVHHEFPLSHSHLKEIPFTAEYTSWFLKYFANENFIRWKNNPKNINKYFRSDIKEDNLKASLKRINNEEIKAKKLLELDEDIIYNNSRLSFEYKKEITVLKVLDNNYYTDNLISPNPGLGSIETTAYFNHRVLKPYLENLLDKDRSNFDNWLLSETEWKEVAFQYNTGKNYQHNQDLTAVFWNSYTYIKQKADAFVQEFNRIPESNLKKLIFNFRQNFPESNRIDGINYFDDLILQLIEYFKDLLNNKSGDQPISINKQRLNQKWYALYYWIKLNSTGSQPPTNLDGQYVKAEIMGIGKTMIEKAEKNIKTFVTGQGFYKQFNVVKDILNNEKQLKSNFGENWKEEIIKLSNQLLDDNEIIINYIKNKYPS